MITEVGTVFSWKKNRQLFISVNVINVEALSMVAKQGPNKSLL